MHIVTVGATIEAALDEVWAVVGDFGKFGDWSPAVLKCRTDEAAAGRCRTLTHPSGEMRVQLIERDAGARRLGYRVVSGSSLPVRDLQAWITVTPAGGQACRVDWRIEGEPTAPADAVIEQLHARYSARLDELREHLMKKAPARRRTLLIVGHPDLKSFGGALAQAYADGALKSGADIEMMHLGSMDFNATPTGRPGPLEPDLLRAREQILRAHHLVLVYPTWMGAMPARMKGFFERVFGDNFAFRFKEGSALPERLLKGRTADVLVTMDTPPFLYRWLLGAPGHKLVRRAILAPAGISPVRIFSYGPVRGSNDKERARWLEATRERACKRLSPSRFA